MTLRHDLATAAVLLGCVLVTLTGPGHAVQVRTGWQLQDPWPSAKETIDIQGQPVTFPSSSPFTPRDTPSAEPMNAVGTLYLPAGIGSAPLRSIPAMVLLHGAGGVLGAREQTYGRQFAAMGAVALIVDVFGARRDRATGFTERLLEITESMAMADAYAGLRFLAHPIRRAAMAGAFAG